MKNSNFCPLCSNKKTANTYIIKNNRYFSCNICGLIFLDRNQLPNREAEIGEYKLHNNNHLDVSYQNHLKKLILPLTPYINKKQKGLDFGCGYCPALSIIMQKMGFINIENYDPYFFNDKTILEKQYDFITSSEVVEHFYQPIKDFSILNKILKKGGVLAVMTQLLLDNIDFKDWYYVNEISHVAFYRIQTLQWIAKHFFWKLKIIEPDIILFFK